MIKLLIAFSLLLLCTRAYVPMMIDVSGSISCWIDERQIDCSSGRFVPMICPLPGGLSLPPPTCGKHDFMVVPIELGLLHSLIKWMFKTVKCPFR